MASDFEVQTRDDHGALKFFDTIGEAMRYARRAPHVWKISWFNPTTYEHVRLIRTITEDTDGSTIIEWVFRPLPHDKMVGEVLKETMGGLDEDDIYQPTWWERTFWWNGWGYVLGFILAFFAIYILWHGTRGV